MAVPCNRCERPLPAWELGKQDLAVCPECGAGSLVRVFPALFEGSREAPRPEAALEGQAACFDHPTKVAVGACGQCGRFVCRLCAVETAGETRCPTCVASALQAPGTSAPNTRTLYDSIALTLALAPMLIWALTLVSAPVTLFVVVRFWRKPLGLVRRSRWRFVLALMIACAQIAAWIWAGGYMAARFERQLGL